MFIDLSTLPPAKVYSWLQQTIAPRPIALASTVDKAGNVNLAPFSFFNLFSSNPPIVIFSPLRRMKDNTTKHTLENILEVPEVVIHLCDYSMVQQVSLASCDFAKEECEFVKTGFTAVESSLVKPPRVKQAKIALECRVNEVKALGQDGGAGNLVIAEVLCMHVEDEILTDGYVDPFKVDWVARLGGDFYARVVPESIFSVPKPNSNVGIGVDKLPREILVSGLSMNEMAVLGNCGSVEEAMERFRAVE